MSNNPAAQPFNRNARQNGNRKAMNRLHRRIAAWAATVAQPKVDSAAYHKPGSMQMR